MRFAGRRVPGSGERGHIQRGCCLAALVVASWEAYFDVDAWHRGSTVHLQYEVGGLNRVPCAIVLLDLHNVLLTPLNVSGLWSPIHPRPFVLAVPACPVSSPVRRCVSLALFPSFVDEFPGRVPMPDCGHVSYPGCDVASPALSTLL